MASLGARKPEGSRGEGLEAGISVAAGYGSRCPGPARRPGSIARRRAGLQARRDAWQPGQRGITIVPWRRGGRGALRHDTRKLSADVHELHAGSLSRGIHAHGGPRLLGRRVRRRPGHRRGLSPRVPRESEEAHAGPLQRALLPRQAGSRMQLPRLRGLQEERRPASSST
jgi:hypothetical protein